MHGLEFTKFWKFPKNSSTGDYSKHKSKGILWNIKGIAQKLPSNIVSKQQLC